MRLPSTGVWVLVAAAFALNACACPSPPVPASAYAINWDTYFRWCLEPKPAPVPGWCKQYTIGALGANVAAAAITTPLLPWPPPRPAHQLPLQGKISTAGTLGNIAERLAYRLQARGYRDFLYYEVPGGFAVTTELERFDDAGQAIAGDKRFARGQVGGWDGFVDLLKKVFVGEDGRFRVFVFVVSSEPFPVADYPAKEVDVERWGRSGSQILPKSIASENARTSTEVTLLVYEFTEDHGKSPMLKAIRASVSGQDHLRWLGYGP